MNELDRQWVEKVIKANKFVFPGSFEPTEFQKRKIVEFTQEYGSEKVKEIFRDLTDSVNGTGKKKGWKGNFYVVISNFERYSNWNNFINDGRLDKERYQNYLKKKFEAELETAWWKKLEEESTNPFFFGYAGAKKDYKEWLKYRKGDPFYEDFKEQWKDKAWEKSWKNGGEGKFWDITE
ncbi:MAG: hypothetical protein UW41_C0006G0031 [Candidatus Collierbacteria bacterium GW2011_GWC2_44_18]|uniref:Uncharacterized protein n=1 Tax=Candidatus Collierbacteria bacterium GW2011_GWC2_44_18 TaxID=1618392 RepID=A0A0G1HS16_9BACT|nr:MAG: hypothetical protein UW41_C0006G0031 [Candidatus Collierbacteria bacterium GW2011_GWC2_44_18]